MNHDPDRIQELFDAAVQLTGEQRANYLMEACGDDLALLKELESLLDNMTSDETMPHAPPGSEKHVVHDRIGPYTILSTLGEGGMGVVYLITKSVKVLKPSAAE